MIGVQHMNGDTRIMDDRIPFDERDSDAPVASDCYPIPSSKKPSLLKSQLLRRTNTRTRKRSPPGVASHSLAKEDYTAEMPLKPTDAPVSVAIVDNVDTTNQSSIDKDNGTAFKTSGFQTNPNTLQTVCANDGKDNKDDGNSFQLHHNAEFEIKNSTIIQKDDASSSLEVSLLESDDESKIEVGATKEGKPPQPKTATTAAVATTNLSIVVTGNDVVVEYRDDSRDDKRCDFSERKEASPQSSKQLPIRSRPKGIMKRPRDSNITYHHPRRPLPPPIPPPGYREASSPMSCTTATSTDDSTYSSAGRGKFLPLRKRVSFNEKELVEQYKMSKVRRQERNERRRSFLGVLSMAMPVIMPYLMAVLILIASSMVPLPTDQRHAQHPLSLQEEFAAWKNKAKAPTPQPILIDVGSRMWDERQRSKEAARSAALEAAVTEYINQETNAAFSSRL